MMAGRPKTGKLFSKNEQASRSATANYRVLKRNCRHSSVASLNGLIGTQLHRQLANARGAGKLKPKMPCFCPTEPKPEPKVPIRSSVKPDFIVCLEDGKRLKMLKRHLMTHYNMTPDQYRQKWGLSPDYPMVAPNYAEQRRTLAKSIGLGTKRKRTRK